MKDDSLPTMDFFTALQKVVQGYRITKAEWKDIRTYGLLKDGLLQLHKVGTDAKVFCPWIVNDGDLLGTDWIILKDLLN